MAVEERLGRELAATDGGEVQLLPRQSGLDRELGDGARTIVAGVQHAEQRRHPAPTPDPRRVQVGLDLAQPREIVSPGPAIATDAQRRSVAERTVAGAAQTRVEIREAHLQTSLAIGVQRRELGPHPVGVAQREAHGSAPRSQSTPHALGVRVEDHVATTRRSRRALATTRSLERERRAGAADLAIGDDAPVFGLDEAARGEHRSLWRDSGL